MPDTSQIDNDLGRSSSLERRLSHNISGSGDLHQGDLPPWRWASGNLLQGERPMKTQQCVNCGTQDAMKHFEGRSFTNDYKQVARQVHAISRWECRVCGEIEFDHDTDRAQRYRSEERRVGKECVSKGRS